MFKPKFDVLWFPTLLPNYTKTGKIDVFPPYDGAGPTVGFFHLSFSFWFIRAKVAWELKK